MPCWYGTGRWPSLSAVGLDPYRGFYHQPRFGRPSLALDLMEPYRPLLADSAVITAVNNGEVGQDDFLTGTNACTLTASGRKRFIGVFERCLDREFTHPIFGYRISYRRSMEVDARLFGRFLSGEFGKVPVWTTR
ncbi:MAG TPA: CRISPR-associated endonuclease Cas1 [Acidobacteriota bacterium]|nr:CRISPR-associated endonuclease Cas1 [Acidobacteriota bacterium]